MHMMPDGAQHHEEGAVHHSFQMGGKTNPRTAKCWYDNTGQEAKEEEQGPQGDESAGVGIARHGQVLRLRPHGSAFRASNSADRSRSRRHSMPPGGKAGQ